MNLGAVLPSTPITPAAKPSLEQSVKLLASSRNSVDFALANLQRGQTSLHTFEAVVNAHHSAHAALMGGTLPKAAFSPAWIAADLLRAATLVAGHLSTGGVQLHPVTSPLLPTAVSALQNARTALVEALDVATRG